jgi:hypothetical protein
MSFKSPQGPLEGLLKSVKSPSKDLSRFLKAFTDLMKALQFEALDFKAFERPLKVLSKGFNSFNSSGFVALIAFERPFKGLCPRSFKGAQKALKDPLKMSLNSLAFKRLFFNSLSLSLSLSFSLSPS